MRAHVADSWVRSAAAGVEVDRVEAPITLPADALRDHREAHPLAAVFPLPKRREAVTPTGFTRRYGNMISARMAAVRRDRLDTCVYENAAPPVDRPEPARTSPPSRRPQASPTPAPRLLPGEEFEQPRSTPEPTEAGTPTPVAEPPEPTSAPSEPADPAPPSD